MRYLIFHLSLLSLLSLTAFSQDLTISNYSGPTSYARYAEFEHTFTLTNAGIVSITEVPTHQFYLSVDDQLDASDYYIGSGEQESYDLQPGGSTPVTVNYSSLNTDPGSYHIICIVDSYNHVTETDETNNTFVISGITLTIPDIDFTFYAFDTDKANYAPYEVIDPSYFIINNGSTNAGNGLYTSFYLSTDNVPSEDDLYLTINNSSLMGSDDTEDWVHFRLITPDVVPGDYYIIARTNYYDPTSESYFEETDVTNNVATKLISIIAFPDLDLSVSSANLLVVFTSDIGFTQFSGSAEVVNSGTIAIGGYQLEIQIRDLSGTPITDYFAITTSDNLNQSVTSVYLNFSYPLSIGTYRYSIRINNNQDIPETDYSNNEFVSSQLIVIEPPPIEQVTINAISVPDTYDNTDEEIYLQFTLTNSGTDPFYVQNFRIEIIDDEANPVYYNEISTTINFAPGTTEIRLIPITLSEPLAVGNYQINVMDGYPYNSIFEQTMTSLTIVPVQYMLTVSVKGEDGTSINKGKLFLYQKDNVGKITFIQKVTPYEGPSFSFPIDQSAHTLYFIPDPVTYPNYVPTIFGKTVTLSEDNFFAATSDMDTVFRILKVNPLPSGRGFINGVVLTEDNAGGRTKENEVPLVSVPVLLLSSTGEVVGITYTNEEGYYEFTDLPRDIYEVVVCMELDYLALATPFTVDLTSLDANLNFTFGAGGVVTTINEVVGIEEDLTTAICYPNPTYGKVNLLIPEQSTITVANALGYTLENIPYNNKELDFTQVPAGVYLIQITHGKSTRALKLIRN